MTYEEAKRVRRTIRNPWLGVALDRVAQFCEPGMFQVEFVQTVLEYHLVRDYHKPFRCSCRGEVHWRPSSGCYKCVGCSKLYRATREPILTREEREAQGVAAEACECHVITEPGGDGLYHHFIPCCDAHAEPHCEGHPAGPFDPMGETVYCDGTCR